VGVSVAVVRTEIQQAPASCTDVQAPILTAKYTVAVLRLADPQHTLLAALSTEPASLNQTFDAQTSTYSVALPQDTDLQVRAAPSVCACAPSMRNKS
jgi:hypothetical protein